VDLLEVQAILLLLKQLFEVRLHYHGVVALITLGELDLFDYGAAIVMPGGCPTIG
jgi:hypothetical protein